MKGNTEITNCHHKHYMGDKNGKTSKIWGQPQNGRGDGPPGPSVEPACPRLEDCTGGWAVEC